MITGYADRGGELIGDTLDFKDVGEQLCDVLVGTGVNSFTGLFVGGAAVFTDGSLDGAMGGSVTYVAGFKVGTLGHKLQMLWYTPDEQY